MPSPFHQKYSSQNHRVFGENTFVSTPEGSKQDADRRGSDSSIGSNPSTADRRRSSTTKFGGLEALKRPTDDHSVNRRTSLQDSYAKTGILGQMWNNYTRGSAGPAAASPPKQTMEPRDTSTLRQ